MSENPDQLRQRAATLRQRANSVVNCSAFALPQRSGEDVWIGPTASRFREDLDLVLAKVRTAIAELLQAANSLEARAELVESAQRLGRPF